MMSGEAIPGRGAKGLLCVPTEDGRGIVVRPRRSRGWMLVFASLWNLAFTVGLYARSPLYFSIIGALATLAFALFAVRSFRSRTTARFDESGRLVVARSGSTLVSHETFDIRSFAVEETKEGSHRVVAVTAGSGARIPLPLPLDGFHIGLQGAERPFMGLTPRPWAEGVAEELTEALERARRSTTGLRIEAPVARLETREMAEEEKEEERVRAGRSAD